MESAGRVDPYSYVEEELYDRRWSLLIFLGVEGTLVQLSTRWFCPVSGGNSSSSPYSIHIHSIRLLLLQTTSTAAASLFGNGLISINQMCLYFIQRQIGL